MNKQLSYPLPKDFKVDFDDLRVVADGLVRPECVLALSNGKIVAANGGGGYSVIDVDGGVRHVVASKGAGRKFLPNGIALAQGGRILFADLGAEVGGIFEIDAEGSIKPIVCEVGGETLPPSNFVVNDSDGRLWFTISTRRRPRTDAWNHDVADGYIGVVDADGVRIVADGIGYTNEIAFSPDGRWLYVNETYNQKTSRYPLLGGARLGAKELVCSYDGADIPDGLAFDAYGGAWITCIASNRLIVLRPDGEQQVVLEDTDKAHTAVVAEKLRSKTLSLADMGTAGHSRLHNISSLAFGGPSLTTAYLGCLLGTTIRSFESPVPGLVPAHWNLDVLDTA
ncbi:SMP-30/gluconolactonase/LRE family protein [Rhizobium rhizogenes]|uniref:SMP-30/gluconolactonase/LRE family protein n=1 Tax=Rhizobium rhizogenes TaxID=359 RepID=UPI001573F7A9|nr:SMP-30/gluconolactonase/LRE family protein [Rhizobium rhizogenes]NTH21837.1 SMP-30/gluconolactonase/LRE family protein [Rhizobium rhizogenes]NTH34980.1 SMP-30/gluconolactonase/LRE family protein [Rhizobium rhizogenes]